MQRGLVVKVMSALAAMTLTLLLTFGLSAAVRASRGSRGDTHRWVVVQKTGWGSGDGRHSFGARVVNRANADAWGVTVTVEIVAGGRVEERESFLIDFIPAGKRFVVADSSHRDSGIPRHSQVIAHVRVRQMERHGSGDRLATVSHVEIDRKNYRVKAVMTNPYPFSINLHGWHAFALLYDSAGRIVGGGKDYRLKGHLKARAQTQIAIYTAAPMPQAKRAEVSVTPP